MSGKPDPIRQRRRGERPKIVDEKVNWYKYRIISCFILIVMKSFGQHTTPGDSNVVWDMEKRYWSSIEKKDLKCYSAMLHPEFSDWPEAMPEPITNRNTMTAFLDDVFKTHQSIKVNLTIEHSKLSGKYAIVYFTSTVAMIDSSNERREETFKMLHIWQKHNNRWLLLGGMQCKK